MLPPEAKSRIDSRLKISSSTALIEPDDRRQLFLPVLEMKYGSQVAKVGDRGKLVISRWLAEQVGLR